MIFPPSIVDDISVNNNANLKAIITPSIVVRCLRRAVIAENTQRKQAKPLPIPGVNSIELLKIFLKNLFEILVLQNLIQQDGKLI